MRPYGSRVKSKKASRKITVWQVGILVAGVIVIMVTLYSMTFRRQGVTGKEEVATMQKAVDQGTILDTPPADLVKMGVKLPEGYEEKAAAESARLEKLNAKLYENH